MNQKEFEKMKGSKLPSIFYGITGGFITGLLIWAIISKDPDGFQWFFAGVLSMGLVMNLVRDREIDKLSK